MFRKPLLAKLFLLFVLLLTFAAACAPSGAGGNDPTTEPEAQESEHNEEGEHTEGEEHDEPERIPNDGAVIRIVSPADGATFKTSDEIIVEIETENFVLGEEDRHWELYLDGSIRYGYGKARLYDYNPKHEI